jgi:sugar phosphate isomerase/epimerase
VALKLSYCTLRWQSPDLEPALGELRRAGWQGWEGRMPLDWLGTPQRLRRICENTGMPMVVYTASGVPEDTSWENVERNKRRIEYAAAVGADCFMFMSGRKPKGRSVSEDDVEAAANGAETWAAYAAQFGLEVSYHIHTNTLIDSSEHWLLYMGMIERSRLCIDVSHAALWGYDPVLAIRDFFSQLNYVHLQDYSSVARGEDGRYNPVWCDVGEAESLDFPAILRTLDELGYDRWVTACPGQFEPGPDSDPSGQARRSRGMREYLRRLGY